MSQTTDEGKACAVLSYLLVGIVWFFWDKKMRRNTFAKFHVKQAIVFVLVLLAMNIGVALLTMVSKSVGSIIGYVVYTGMTILWILAVVFAAAGKEQELFLFGQISRILDF